MSDHELRAGATLLYFELIEKVGEGGMGVVWRARDTTLDREVAIKILPAVFAADADRLARFEREAKLLASLNHPHIASIYGVHESDGVRFLSMELVPGEDLAQLLERGPMPLERALRVARDVAEALETAHESGVVHRDLKPANIRLTREGKAKVLDFGLAKAAEPATQGDPSHSPTLTSAGTAMGMIMGTAAYMSPEQAAGLPTDRRCDIWSFGVVLVEMLSGRRLFHGETISHTLADVLRSDIDLGTLPPGVPPAIRRLIERCLDRNASRRLRDIGEARVALEVALEHPEAAEETTVAAGAPAARTTTLPWLVAAVAGLAAIAAVGWAVSRGGSTEEPVRRFTLAVPNSGYARQGDGRAIAISSDGRLVVTRGGAGSDDALYVRALDEFEPRPIPGTAGGRLPQFSPDDRSVLFKTSSGLKRVGIAGGSPTAVGWVPAASRSFDWADDGAIYFANEGRLWRLQLDEGEPEPLTEPAADAADGFFTPSVLPGTRGVLCSTRGAPGNPGRLHVLDLASGEMKDLGLDGNDPRFLHSGHILYQQLEQILAAPFDIDALAVVGSGTPVLPRVWIDQGIMQLDVADDGTVAYMPMRDDQTQALVRVDRSGSIESLVAAGLPFATLNDPRIAPDGTRLAVTVSGGAIWMVDLTTQTPTLLTEEGFYPLWSPDSREVVFSTSRNPTFDVMRVPVDLSRPEKVVLDTDHNLRTMDWTADGAVVIREEIPDKGMDLRLWADPDGEATLVNLMDGPDDELAPTVSPDGRFMAYVSDYSGVDEIYVTSFPQAGFRTRVSLRGGNSPSWSPDGSDLYYVEDTTMIALSVDTSAGFRVTGRSALFEGQFVQYRWSRQYDVMPDGSGFVMIENPERGDIEVVTGWFAELRDPDD